MKFHILLAVIVVIVSLILLFDKLFAPRPIEIVLETGQAVTSSAGSYFSLADALLLITTSFLTGLLSAYLYHQGEIPTLLSPHVDKYAVIEPLLKPDELLLFSEIKKKGELLQNALVITTRLSKVKVARVLARLERKGVIFKERRGLTNLIKLR